MTSTHVCVFPQIIPGSFKLLPAAFYFHFSAVYELSISLGIIRGNTVYCYKYNNYFVDNGVIDV